MFNLSDVIAGVLEGDELAAARQRDRIVEGPLPATIGLNLARVESLTSDTPRGRSAILATVAPYNANPMKRFFWTIASLVTAIPAFILMLPGLAAVEFANYCERKRRESISRSR